MPKIGNIFVRIVYGSEKEVNMEDPYSSGALMLIVLFFISPSLFSMSMFLLHGISWSVGQNIHLECERQRERGV